MKRKPYSYRHLRFAGLLDACRRHDRSMASLGVPGVWWSLVRLNRLLVDEITEAGVEV